MSPTAAGTASEVSEAAALPTSVIVTGSPSIVAARPGKKSDVPATFTLLSPAAAALVSVVLGAAPSKYCAASL